MSGFNFPPNAYGGYYPGISLDPRYNPLVRIMNGMQPQAAGGGGGPLQPQQPQRQQGAGLPAPQPPRPYAGAGAQPANATDVLGQVNGLNTALKGLKGLWGGAAPAAVAPDMSLSSTLAGLGPEAGFVAPGAGMDMGAVGAGNLGIDTGLSQFIPSTPIWTGAGGALDAAGTGAAAAEGGAALGAGALDATATGAAALGAGALGEGALDAGLAAGAGEAAAAGAGEAAAAEGGADWLLALLALL